MIAQRDARRVHGDRSVTIGLTGIPVHDALHSSDSKHCLQPYFRVIRASSRPGPYEIQMNAAAGIPCVGVGAVIRAHAHSYRPSIAAVFNHPVSAKTSPLQERKAASQCQQSSWRMYSNCEVSAVHDEFGAGHVRRLVGREEQRGVGDLDRVGRTSDKRWPQ